MDPVEIAAELYGLGCDLAVDDHGELLIITPMHLKAIPTDLFQAASMNRNALRDLTLDAMHSSYRGQRDETK
jgi:hypothetical protein